MNYRDERWARQWPRRIGWTMTFIAGLVAWVVILTLWEAALMRVFGG